MISANIIIFISKKLRTVLLSKTETKRMESRHENLLGPILESRKRSKFELRRVNLTGRLTPKDRFSLFCESK